MSTDKPDHCWWCKSEDIRLYDYKPPKQGQHKCQPDCTVLDWRCENCKLIMNGGAE